MSSYQYRKSHCGDKTVVRSSYLHNGISYTGKMSSLYWIGALTFKHNEFTPNMRQALRGIYVQDMSHLTHWGRVTHICISKLTIIGSDNGFSLGRHQAIIWTDAGILLIGPLGTNFSEILIEIHTFSFKKMHLKMSSGKWRPFCFSLSVLCNP